MSQTIQDFYYNPTEEDINAYNQAQEELETERDRKALSMKSKQLRSSFRGFFYRDGKFVSALYLVDGIGYVLDVEYGAVKSIIEKHPAKSYKRAGISTGWTGQNDAQKWELKCGITTKKAS